MNTLHIDDLARVAGKPANDLWRIVATVNGHAVDVTRRGDGLYVNIRTLPSNVVSLVRRFASSNESF
ncbi:MAG: hypothetical protein WCC08_08715 [Terrimicrobiaceae bacterium]